MQLYTGSNQDNKSTIIMILLFCTSLFSASIITVDFVGFKLSIFRGLVFLCFSYLCLTPTKKYNIYSAFMLLWLLWGLLGGILVTDRSAWIKELFFVLVAVTCVEFFRRKMVSSNILIRMCKAFTLFIGIHNGIGYYEIITRHYSWVSPELSKTYGFIYGYIPVSVFYNANNYATVLLFGIAIAAIAIKYSRAFEKFIFIPILVSSIIQIILTLSRANLIALSIGFFLFLAIKRVRNQNRIIIAILLVVVGGFILASPMGGMLISKVASYFNFKITNGSENLRITLLEAGWKSFKQSYFLGTGAGNLPVSITLITGIPGGQLHFWWLDVLFTYGPLIWILYIGCYLRIVKENFLQAIDGSFVSRVLFAYMVAYVVGACSSSSVMSLEAIWAAWAFIIAYRINSNSINL